MIMYNLSKFPFHSLNSSDFLPIFYPFTVQLDLSYLFKFFKYHPSKLSMGKSPIIPNTYMLVL